MPKYLCKDYLSEALQHHRRKKECMEVKCPHHIEFVNQYVHMGKVEGENTHLSPWNILERLVEYPHLPCISCTDSSISDNLAAIAAVKGSQGTPGLGLDIEPYKPSDDRDVSGDNELWLLSQDIDSAMEKFMSPSNDESVTAVVTSEKFAPVKLLMDDLQVDEGHGELLLEELESTMHLEGLLQLMPTVEVMAARLKPKLIQDPFLDLQGKPYVYSNICSCDFSFDMAEVEEELDGEQNSAELQQERFLPDELELQACGLDIDHILELPMAEEEKQPLIADDAIQSAVATTERLLPESEDSKTTSSVLEELVEQCKRDSDLQVLEVAPDFVAEEVKDVDFVKLNNEGIGHVSTDSGIGNVLLESPFIPPPNSPILTSTPLLQRQLEELAPMPITPEGELVILSPGSVKKQLKEIWEKEKLFDAVLALTLPCPEVKAQIGEILTVEDAISKLNIQPLKFDGNIEFELNWDPLEALCKDMCKASNAIVSREPVFEDSIVTSGGLGEESSWKESFVCNPYVHEEVEDTPLSPVRSCYREEEQKEKKDGVEPSEPLESDIPDLCLQPAAAAPPGYLRPSNDTRIPPLPISSPPLPSRSLDPWRVVQQAASTTRHQSKTDLYNFSTSPQNNSAKKPKPVSAAAPDFAGVSALDAFLMLRTGMASDGVPMGRKRARTDCGDCRPENKKLACENTEADDTMELVIIEKKTTPVFHDVCLTGKYLTALSKMERLALSLRSQLEGCGLSLPIQNGWPRVMEVDSLKFFLKQQQKVLEDNQGNGLRSCQFAACLYLTGSVLDTLMHCSFKTAISHFSTLLEKYSHLLNENISPLKEIILELEADEQFYPHPKLTELVRVVSHWKKETRRSCRDKVVVVVAREFSALSGEILDYLQSIPGLESCVFSLTSCEASNELYKNAVEERFHHYDCLVVPLSALSNHSSFLWEKVSLLIEYEKLKTPLFETPSKCCEGDQVYCDDPPAGSVVERLLLHDYITLRTVLDLSTSNVSFSTACDGTTYTVMASESVTSNSQLLQLLETRYDVLVIEREYSSLAPSKWLSWADLSISQGVGVLIRPISILASAEDAKTLIRTVTALSLQYQTCWVVLYHKDQNSYELGGCVPHQLSLLHASVAPLHPHYRVRILMASSTPHMARLIRRVIEETHQMSNTQIAPEAVEWDDRNWLSEELTKKEKFLLSFPCIHTFSAQFMLRRFTLSWLLAADLSLLREKLPGMPDKVLKLFHKMCHVSAVAATSTAGYSPNIPALPDTAKYPPASTLAHQTNPKELRHLNSKLPVFPPSDAAVDFSMDSDSGNQHTRVPTLLGQDSHYQSYEDNTTVLNDFSYTTISDSQNIPSTVSYAGASQYNAPVSSPVLGLDDSLEDMEFSTVISTGDCDAASCGPKDPEPWICQPAVNSSITASDSDFFGARSSDFFSQVRKSTSEEWKKQQLLHPSHQMRSAPLSYSQARNLTYNPLDPQTNLAHSFSFNPLNKESEDHSSMSNDNTHPMPSSHNWNVQLENPTSIPNPSLTSSTAAFPGLQRINPVDRFSHTGNSNFAAGIVKPVQPSWTKFPLQSQRSESITSTWQHATSSRTAPNLAVSSTSVLTGSNLVPRSSKAIASLVVRKPRRLPPTSTAEQKPVKALDLGLESERERNVTLRSNDRILAAPTNPAILSRHARRNKEVRDSDRFAGEIVKSKYFSASSSSVNSNSQTSNSSTSSSRVGTRRLADLKAFHLQEGRQYRYDSEL